MYKVIYADPPWQYISKSVPPSKEVTNHYQTMSVDAIKALPIKEITAKDSLLFLWTTFPCLPEALSVIEAWGFSYKTVGFVWVKQNKRSDSLFWGMGAYTRANAEICLIGRKGNPKIQRHDIHSVIISRVGKHSEKPIVARERIEALTGDVPKIELFARTVPDGWDVWGNEVACSIELT